ncbi:MAG: alkaline phosphatase family protein [Bacteroidota bacterium]|nr:alkaline phosphatase family protein [Bacteroidota bacterium]
MRFLNLIIFHSILSLIGCAPERQHEQHKTSIVEEYKADKKAIFIIVDGIPADVVEKVSTPHLDNISQKGGYARIFVGGEKGSYNETPTISAPGYMDLLTATWANKHNVWDNYNQEPNYNYWNIFRLIETGNPDAKTAIFSTWEDNRTILVGEGAKDAGGFKIDYAFDGFEKDTVRFPHDPLRNYIAKIDSLVVEEAADYISNNGPDLSWVYLEYPDDVGHGLGDSDYFYKSVENADQQIGKIWEAVEKRIALGEEWMIVVTTDHGRDAETGKDHGGQTDRERLTWLVTNQGALNNRFTSGNMSILDITPSILHFMDIALPQEVKYEMDGTSFIGNVAADSLRASIVGNALILNWKLLNDTAAKAKVLVSFTNGFKTGTADHYELLDEIVTTNNNYTHTLSARQIQQFREKKFMKVVLETQENTLNRWIFKEN